MFSLSPQIRRSYYKKESELKALRPVIFFKVIIPRFVFDAIFKFVFNPTETKICQYKILKCSINCRDCSLIGNTTRDLLRDRLLVKQETRNSSVFNKMISKHEPVLLLFLKD